MLKLIDRIDLLRGLNRGALRAYLLSCAKNAALNRLRAQDRLYNFDDAEAIACDRPVECEIDAGLLREAQVTAMRTVLERMPDRERELLRMKYYEQLDDSANCRNPVSAAKQRARPRAARAAAGGKTLQGGGRRCTMNLFPTTAARPSARLTMRRSSAPRFREWR